MPLEYKIYGCKFKCGHSHTKDFDKMYIHEEKCFKNPDNKSCFTCKHASRFRGCYGDTGEYGQHINPDESPYRECNNGDYLSNYHEKLYTNIVDGDRSMLFAKRLHLRALNEDGTIRAYTLYDDLYNCINVHCEGWEMEKLEDQ